MGQGVFKSVQPGTNGLEPSSDRLSVLFEETARPLLGLASDLSPESRWRGMSRVSHSSEDLVVLYGRNPS